MSKAAPARPTSCFLLGYGGSNNTGADVRILTIIEDIQACFGRDTRISVGTLNRERTLRSLPETDTVTVVQIPYVFPLRVFELASRHDITFLVEGSTFKQNWSSALLYCFLWGAWCAKRAGNRCVAYAVDAGELSRFNRFLTRRVCDRIDLLITRTQVARERLAALGVRKPIIANTDTAFTFLPDRAPRPKLPEPMGTGTVGIAPIEFHQWPVRLKLWGPKSECYHWPYYYSWSPERREKSERTVAAYRRLVDHCIDARDLDVVLIAMEELDTEVCEKILSGIDPDKRSRVRLLSSRDNTPFEMVPELRALDYLVTARYHACVLSLRTGVPQMAVCHDERLRAIYEELGLERDFLLSYDDPDLGERMIATFERMVAGAPALRSRIQEKHDAYFLPACRENRAALSAWAAWSRQQPARS